MCLTSVSPLQVSSAATEDELQSVLEKYDLDFLFACDYSNATNQIHLQYKDKLFTSVWLHYVLFQPQLKNGIRNTLDIDMLMLLHADSMWGLFASSSMFEVTPEYLSDLFIIMYSEKGGSCHLLMVRVHL